MDNQTQEYKIANPGELNLGGPLAGYESYVQVQMRDVPQSVDVQPQKMVLFFLWCTHLYNCGPYICYDSSGSICGWIFPGFFPHPYAWIKKIKFGSGNSFGIKATKRIPFQRLPFFSRSVDISHSNRVKITGNIWSGYEPRLSE